MLCIRRLFGCKQATRKTSADLTNVTSVSAASGQDEDAATEDAGVFSEAPEALAPDEHKEKHWGVGASIEVLSSHYMKLSQEMDQRSYHCKDCWLMNDFCICAQHKDITSALNEQYTVVVYTHYQEMVSQRGSNTGKLLVKQGAFRAVCGNAADEEQMMGMVEDNPLALILFPASSALTAREFKEKRNLLVTPASSSSSPSFKEVNVSTPHKITIVLLDGTWTQAKMLNRRMDQLAKARSKGTSSSVSSSVQHPLPLARVKLTDAVRSQVGALRKSGTIGSSQRAEVKVSSCHAFIALLTELGASDSLTSVLYFNLNLAITAFHKQLNGSKRFLLPSSSSSSSFSKE